MILLEVTKNTMLNGLHSNVEDNFICNNKAPFEIFRRWTTPIHDIHSWRYKLSKKYFYRQRGINLKDNFVGSPVLVTYIKILNHLQSVHISYTYWINTSGTLCSTVIIPIVIWLVNCFPTPFLGIIKCINNWNISKTVSITGAMLSTDAGISI